MRKKTKEYQTFVLKDTFPEYKLKEYMNKIKNILQKNGECKEVGDEFTEDENGWCYTNGEHLHYFLEEDSDLKEDINDKDTVKKQNCLNLGNLERLNSKCEMEENQSIDHLGSSRLPIDPDQLSFGNRWIIQKQFLQWLETFFPLSVSSYHSFLNSFFSRR